MSKAQQEIERIANQILSDSDVDWSSLSANVRLEEADAVDGLKLLEELMRGFRHTHVSASASGNNSGKALFRFGGLEVRELLGEGGSGEVYRAYDPLLDQEVALKLRKPTSEILTHRFLEEARKVVRVRHTNIVSVYGAGVDEGRVGIWMELVRGESLESRVRRGVFSIEETIVVATDLCSALSAIHRHGLIHGDVKASNVLREPGGRIVLADFGSARDVSDQQSPIVSSTLQYTAPEVLAGEPHSEASDIYALGVLLFRLLTGRYPSDAEGRAANTKEAKIAEVRRDVPRNLALAIDAALRIDPKQRLASARSFADLLARKSFWSRTSVAALCVMSVLAIGIALVAMLYARNAAAGWDVSAEMLRVGNATFAPLPSGSTVHVGDLLSLRWSSSKRAYVYVFNADVAGNAAVLFPLDGTVHDPLQANEEIFLPAGLPTGGLSWQIDGETPSDEFVVLAAIEPLPDVDRIVASWTRPRGTARSALGLAVTPSEARLNNSDLNAIIAEARKHHAPEALRVWRFAYPHGRNQ